MMPTRIDKSDVRAYTIKDYSDWNLIYVPFVFLIVTGKERIQKLYWNCLWEQEKYRNKKMEMVARTEAGKRKRYQNRDSLAQSYCTRRQACYFIVSTPNNEDS